MFSQSYRAPAHTDHRQAQSAQRLHVYSYSLGVECTGSNHRALLFGDRTKVPPPTMSYLGGAPPFNSGRCGHRDRNDEQADNDQFLDRSVMLIGGPNRTRTQSSPETLA